LHACFSRYRTAARLRFIAIGQRVQEGHDILDIAIAQRRLVARVTIQRRLPVQIAPVRFRQIVELLRLAVRGSGVPLLRLRVPFRVKPHGVLEPMKDSVVEKYAAKRNIAQ
jgi:hypothetical protein